MSLPLSRARRVTRALPVLAVTALMALTPVVATTALAAPGAPAAPVLAAPDPAPLVHAHSHNDYLRRRPLQDALDQGFTSVEADVWLRNGTLCLGHGGPDCRKTLEKDYLQPLQQRVDQRGGSVYAGDDGPFQLLIELKSDGRATWPEVEKALAKYPRLVRHFQGGRRIDGPVVAVITGNRPKDMILGAQNRWSGFDGGLDDIGRYDGDVMPLASADWGKVFRWRGNGPMPADQQQRLRGYADAAHANGTRLRFWATPGGRAGQNVWAAELEAGVDWLNADNPAELARFLRSRG